MVAHRPAIFLAGGISECPEWQDVARDDLADLGCTLLNPRRKEALEGREVEQIEWEHQALREADAVLL